MLSRSFFLLALCCAENTSIGIEERHRMGCKAREEDKSVKSIGKCHQEINWKLFSVECRFSTVTWSPEQKIVVRVDAWPFQPYRCYQLNFTKRKCFLFRGCVGGHTGHRNVHTFIKCENMMLSDGKLKHILPMGAAQLLCNCTRITFCSLCSICAFSEGSMLLRITLVSPTITGEVRDWNYISVERWRRWFGLLHALHTRRSYR